MDVLAFLDRVDPALLTPSTAPIEALRAFAAFLRATEDAAGPLCFGDALVYGRIPVTAADRWIVAGGGDHALATAEALPGGNPAARVTVVAGAVETAAVSTARYVDLWTRHSAADGGDGRLEFRTGAEPGPLNRPVPLRTEPFQVHMAWPRSSDKGRATTDEFRHDPQS
ncbi:hypothetical protein ACFWUZ_22740 [Streptomyces sp. NPDC058646]|uniref:hypothetical protein n=1 Tax=Streptomyces sp. NPDC058646 TaxID=3346574 RepID=UPI00366981AC